MRATLSIIFLATTVAVAGLGPRDAFAQAPPTAGADVMPMKEVPLTQKLIDGVIASLKPIQAIEAKQPQDASDKVDPKLEAELSEVVKKHGFASLAEYSDVTSSIGIVMSGMDPKTKAYIGPGALIKKQIADIEGDKAMPPKEKAEALAELKEAMSAAASVKPMQSNIDLVAKNFDTLSANMEADAK